MNEERYGYRIRQALNHGLPDISPAASRRLEAARHMALSRQKQPSPALASATYGQNSTLRLSIHEPFRQRIVMNYNLEGMTKAEGHSYVTAKLNGAGCTQTVFEENALEAILNAANGTPRMINKLCNASLLVGNSSNLNIITADAVMQAINDCELG